RNAVREHKVAHAYLFSGPRGTGKTSTARILAKALNCTNLQDGEPCGACESCVQVQRGASLDVVELDAASNRKLDEMRDLLSRVAPEAIDLVVRKGGGSARDALSVLDQVAAAGEVSDEGTVIDAIVEALCERDAGAALVALAEGMAAGRDPRQMAVDLVTHLRN